MRKPDKCRIVARRRSNSSWTRWPRESKLISPRFSYVFNLNFRVHNVDQQVHCPFEGLSRYRTQRRSLRRIVTTTIQEVAYYNMFLTEAILESICVSSKSVGRASQTCARVSLPAFLLYLERQKMSLCPWRCIADHRGSGQWPQ